ncbi:MAG: PAS domain S-box protein [Gemmatimonadetes bacterium]|nr:PAS domain S-box protein [Gemmatimonadota bacterium]
MDRAAHASPGETRRSGRLALLAKAQRQLTAQLTQHARTDRLPRAIADAILLVLPATTCEVWAEDGATLRRLVRLSIDAHDDDAPDLTLAYAARDAAIPLLASRAVAEGPDRGRTELCAPAHVCRNGHGVIRVLADASAELDTEDLELVTILARHAAAAAETARLLALQLSQRRRAEAAAALARASLHATSLADGAATLLRVLDRTVPSSGKALGVARARDGHVEYVATSGSLSTLLGHRPAGPSGIAGVAPQGRAVVIPALRTEAPPDRPDLVPDEWAFVLPLASREHLIGVVLVTTPRSQPLTRRDQRTLRRLAAPLSLSLDALMLDEEEHQAREREHLLATALTTIDHPIFILDRVGVRYANMAAAREYGWSQGELMEMRFEDLVVGADTRQALVEHDGVLEPGVRVSHDIHRRRDGSEFPAAVNVSTLSSQEGEPLGRVVSIRNMSQDRNLEEQLRHTEKMVALGELVSGVAHEINNPLTGISAFAQLLLEESLTAEQRESVQLIKQESDRATAVIHDLLLFARKTGRGVEPLDVNALVEHVVRLRAYPLRTAGVTVSLQLDPARPHVRGDAQKLQQVLLNLVSNAEHAMQGRTVRTLTLSTASESGDVRIEVRDTGAGMTDDVRRRIFEPFYSTKPPGMGTGLGLSVSYGIVQAHGGRFTVESVPDAGTVITLLLPALAAVT